MIIHHTHGAMRPTLLPGWHACSCYLATADWRLDSRQRWSNVGCRLSCSGTDGSTTRIIRPCVGQCVWQRFEISTFLKSNQIRHKIDIRNRSTFKSIIEVTWVPLRWLPIWPEWIRAQQAPSYLTPKTISPFQADNRACSREPSRVYKLHFSTYSAIPWLAYSSTRQ